MSSRGVVKKLARGAINKLPPSTQDRARRLRDELAGLGQLKANQNLLTLRIAELERKLDGEIQDGPATSDPRFPAHIRSRLCTQSQLESPWFKQWCDAMGIPPYAHRKQWEFAYIAEVLDSLGVLTPGKRGVGFGVGREPLVSLLASRGVSVTATDLPPDAQEASGWIKSAQHAEGGLEGMLNPAICDPDDFRRLVTWRPVDMRQIPDDLVGFDFCWSACSLEHIGTLGLGLDFVENSLKTLRPGESLFTRPSSTSSPTTTRSKRVPLSSTANAICCRSGTSSKPLVMR